MIIHDNGTKIFSPKELQELKTNQSETSYTFRENELFLSDCIFTDESGNNHIYSIMKWPSFQMVAGYISELETALRFIDTINQVHSLPSIQWQPISQLPDKYFTPSIKILAAKKEFVGYYQYFVEKYNALPGEKSSLEKRYTRFVVIEQPEY